MVGSFTLICKSVVHIFESRRDNINSIHPLRKIVRHNTGSKFSLFAFLENDLLPVSILNDDQVTMGAGLERFAWITMGTPTAYDCCFGPITQKLINCCTVLTGTTTSYEYVVA